MSGLVITMSGPSGDVWPHVQTVSRDVANVNVCKNMSDPYTLYLKIQGWYLEGCTYLKDISRMPTNMSLRGLFSLYSLSGDIRMVIGILRAVLT